MVVYFRFVDRDMMMRFLSQWGIGHLDSTGFRHEADALVASEEDRQLSLRATSDGISAQDVGDLPAGRRA